MKTCITKVASAALFIACTAFSVVAEHSVTADAATEEQVGRWIGPDGAFLPFSSDEEVLAFLRTAEVIDRTEIKGSLNRPLKLLLEREGVRAHAIFRTVNVERETMRNVQEHARGFRDHYEYEVAAYELSRLLGLNNVPPATLRTLGREKGSIQLWVEQAMGVQERLQHGIDKRYEQLWLFQKQNMAVFDNLIYNFDRNPGNFLIDSQGQTWFIDHTRSFKKLPALNGRADIKVCQRSLYEKLRQLNSETVHERLDPYLTQVEIDALMARRKKLVKFLEKKIKQYGEDAILFQFVQT